MRRTLLSLTAAAALLCGAGGAAWAAAWGVNYEESAITFSGEHAGNAFEGRFEKWDANIEFDPAAPEEAVVLVTIDTASATTGNALYDGTLVGADWFDTGTFPEARFEAFGATPDGEGRYTLNGQLTIRDNSVPVSVVFQASDSEASADSTVMLKRLEFGLGANSDPTGGWVSLEIPVTVKLRAHPSAE